MTIGDQRAAGLRWPLLSAFALAGALAVPPSPVVTPVSAVAACVVGLMGMALWRWSRLPWRVRSATTGRLAVLRCGLWMALGLGVGLVVLAVIRVAIEPMVPAIGTRIAAAGRLPLWRRAAVIYVAAVGEEVAFRLILLSAAAGLVARLRRLPERVPDASAFWIANAVAALAFGLAHLPSWSGIAPGARSLPFIVTTLNASGGLVLGYIFGTRGIAAAICTHAGADCAIQIIGPLTG